MIANLPEEILEFNLLDRVNGPSYHSWLSQCEQRLPPRGFLGWTVISNFGQL